MSDFLARLAARALGQAPTVQPRLPSRYEPAPKLAVETPYVAEVSAAESFEEASGEPTVSPALPARPSSRPSPPPPALAWSAERLETREARETPEMPETRPTSEPPERPERPAITAGRSGDPAAVVASRAEAVEAAEAGGGVLSRASGGGTRRGPTAASEASRPAPPSVHTPLRSTQEPEQTVPAPFAAAALRSASVLPPRRPDPATAGGTGESELPPELPARETEAPPRSELPAERPPRVPRATLREEPSRPAIGSPPIGSPAAGLPRQNGPAAAAEPVVRVTIGRIEVRAAAPPRPAATPRPAVPRLTLEEYLRRRNEGRM